MWCFFCHWLRLLLWAIMDIDDHEYEVTTPKIVLAWPTCQGVGDILGQHQVYKETTEAPREKPRVIWGEDTRRIGTWSEVITRGTEVTFLHGCGKKGTPLACGTAAVNPDWLEVKRGTVNLFLSAPVYRASGQFDTDCYHPPSTWLLAKENLNLSLETSQEPLTSERISLH